MTAPAYLQLVKGGVYFRMFVLKGIVFNSTQGFKPPSMAIKDWREARRYGFHNWREAYIPLSQVVRDGETAWHSHTGEQFRNEQYCDLIEDVRIDHTGWYCDPDLENNARGIVGALTHGRFIAGYELSMNGERVYFGKVHDDEKDAARMADKHARIIAEQEFEYQIRFSEAQGVERELECALDRIRECITLRNVERFRYVRNEISILTASIREMRNRLETEFKDVL